MSPPTLVIASISDSLPSCSPNLMPFLINFTGTAPISTYLRVEPANEAVAAPPPVDAPLQESGTQESEETLAENLRNVAVITSTTIETEHTNVQATRKETETKRSQSPSLANRVTAATTRFISAFRGRTIQGLKVELPTGYTGVVFKTEGESGSTTNPSKDPRDEGRVILSKGKGNSRAKGRVTRSVKRAINLDEEDDEPDEKRRADADAVINDDVDEHIGLPELDDAMRTLIPTYQFSSFVLWNPDIPVDEGKDEYIRSLTEWTRLAAEIHRTE